MAGHSDAHEQLLRKLVTEEDDARGALGRSEQADCPECEQQLDELLAVADRLVAAGGYARDGVRDAAGVDDVVGAEAVDRILGRELRAARSRRIAGQLRWAAASFAGLAAVFLLVFWFGGPPAETPTSLGGAGEWTMQPSGEVEAWGTFRWSGEAGSRYEIRVFGADASDATISERAPWYDAQWTPSEEETGRWPDRITWEVRVFDDAGALRATHSAEASLEPR